MDLVARDYVFGVSDSVRLKQTISARLQRLDRV